MEIDSQETVPSKSNFEQDRITDDVKNKILKSTFDLQAKLEFLGLEKEKAEQ
jgi:DNA-nicking Smr family endonuclease